MLEPDRLQQYLKWAEMVVDTESLAMRCKWHNPVHSVTNVLAESLAGKYCPVSVGIRLHAFLPERVDVGDVQMEVIIAPWAKHPILQDESIDTTVEASDSALESLKGDLVIALNDFFRLVVGQTPEHTIPCPSSERY